MENKRNLIRLYIPVGLLLVCGSTLINHLIMPLPDAVNGFITGAGIGLLIMGLIKQRQFNSAN